MLKLRRYQPKKIQSSHLKLSSFRKLPAVTYVYVIALSSSSLSLALVISLSKLSHCYRCWVYPPLFTLEIQQNTHSLETRIANYREVLYEPIWHPFESDRNMYHLGDTYNRNLVAIWTVTGKSMECILGKNCFLI